MNEIETKRKELEEGIKNNEYMNREFYRNYRNALYHFNLGVEMARKELAENIKKSIKRRYNETAEDLFLPTEIYEIIEEEFKQSLEEKKL